MEERSSPRESGDALASVPGSNCQVAEGEIDTAIQIAERVRVQELLRYFQPSTYRDAGVQQGEVSSDKTLTALAQLAAFKFGCQRSFISLVDHEYQYIIAEATRSISLESAKVRDHDDDALLTGATALNLVWGMCASTMKVFTTTDGRHNVLTQYLKADKESYVIHDMSQVDEYKERPYVAGWPFMRFYAEVPISSPNGLAIGSICVVNNQARHEFGPKDINTLKELADTVMDHLDLVMSRVQRKRAQQMIKGLGTFADARNGKNSSNMQQGIGEDMRRLTVKDPNPEGSVVSLESLQHKPSTAPAISDDYASQPLPGPAADLFLGSTSPGPRDTAAPFDRTAADFSGSDSARGSSCSVGASEHTYSAGRGSPAVDNDRRDRMLPTGFEQTLLQAVDLIRGAVNLDRVVFFDQQYLSNHGVLSDNASGNEYAREDIAKNASQKSHLTAKVLVDSSENKKVSLPDVSRTLLSTIVKHLPRGGILRFDSYGVLVEHAEFDLLIDTFRNKNTSRDKPLSSIQLSHVAGELNKSFACRSMVLFPLWASTGDDLFAYAIGATYEETRVFQREDFAYITSFSNLLTGELSRLDVLSADHAKSVFISSISHELRSPLHGILASAELLKDSVVDKTALDIINTIESCGSTLLDTFDNLLSFAKINHFTVAQSQLEPKTGYDVSRDVKSLSSVFDLSSLVEEVMNSILAGHYFRTRIEKESTRSSLQNSGSPNSKNDILHIICDVQDADWVISTQAGAWTRIVMNLFGNAMKYTHSGFIRVGLKLNECPRSISGDEESEIVLCVEDSGQGISERFLANNLYKPFHQENVLRPGTGLGLSIVKQLVHSINGTVSVTSKVNHGTTFTITAKVMRPRGDENLGPLQARWIEAPLELHGLRVGLLGFDLPTSLDESTTAIEYALNRRNQATKYALNTTLERLGLLTTTVSSIDSKDIDILLTTEENYYTASRESQSTQRVPIIILNSSLTLDYRDVTHDGGPLVYLSQPFGRTRLVKALQSCLSFHNRTVKTVPETTIVESVPTDIQADRFGAEKTDVSPIINNHTTTTDDARQGSPRILLVEDNVINLKLLVAFMRKLKCPFETATDGQEAVDAYCANGGNFDAIFMDIQMPNKDGMAASSEIRAFEKEKSLSRTLIIAITGLASLEAHRQAALCGVDSMLTKPVSLKSLKTIVEGLSGD